jgi:hypothetical protein
VEGREPGEHRKRGKRQERMGKGKGEKRGRGIERLARDLASQ